MDLLNTMEHVWRDGQGDEILLLRGCHRIGTCSGMYILWMSRISRLQPRNPRELEQHALYTEPQGRYPYRSVLLSHLRSLRQLTYVKLRERVAVGTTQHSAAVVYAAVLREVD